MQTNDDLVHLGVLAVRCMWITLTTATASASIANVKINYFNGMYANFHTILTPSVTNFSSFYL